MNKNLIISEVIDKYVVLNGKEKNGKEKKDIWCIKVTQYFVNGIFSTFLKDK